MKSSWQTSNGGREAQKILEQSGRVQELLTLILPRGSHRDEVILLLPGMSRNEEIDIKIIVPF